MEAKNGFFGEYGGAFVSEKMQIELNKIDQAFNILIKDKNFIDELNEIRANYQGRPTPLFYCKKLTDQVGGAKIYLKREDLNHTGAHKINHCVGEALLAKYLKKTKVIGETGAGQHGLALATACAYFGLECEIHMGEVDIIKQHTNVEKMKLLGAKIVCVTEGSKTLKEAVDSSYAAYEKDLDNSIYCIGSVVGPHPFPTIVKYFQSIVGQEAKAQYRQLFNKLPTAIVACVGGGSNSIGLFNDFLDEKVDIFGVEPLGKGSAIGQNACTIQYGSEGILHGFKSLVLKDGNGNVADAYSVASGLDYPGVGPEHAYLNSIKRVKYVAIDDAEAIDAFYTLSRLEGIIPALESSHAVAFGMKLAKTLSKDDGIIVNLSGRGDKDVDYVLSHYNKLNK